MATVLTYEDKKFMNCKLITGADHHFGTFMHYSDGMKAMLEDLSKPNTYMIGVGDHIEGISSQDKRYSAHQAIGSLFVTPQRQAKGYAELLKPFSKKVLSVSMGNHEEHNCHTYDSITDISEHLGCQAGNKMHRLVFKYRDKRFKIGVFHGEKLFKSNAKDYLQQMGNIMSSLKLQLNSIFADCILCIHGHIHQQFTVQPTYDKLPVMVERNGKLTQKFKKAEGIEKEDFIPADMKWYVQAASMRLNHPPHHIQEIFDKNNIIWDDYSVRKGLAPSVLGYSKIHIEDGKPVFVEEVRV